MAIASYPLTWPQGWKRIPGSNRKNGVFSVKGRVNASRWVTVSDGVTRVLEQLRMMGVDKQDVILSTNVRTRLDGMPRSGESEPADPGAAVYWQQRHGAPMKVMAIDRYTTVADNLAAIAATLEAMRAIERHGGAEILDRAFTGFKALAAENAGPSWWSVLQISAEASEEEIQAAYRSLAKIAHTDSPTGSDEMMRALNVARDQALIAARGRS